MFFPRSAIIHDMFTRRRHREKRLSSAVPTDVRFMGFKMTNSRLGGDTTKFSAGPGTRAARASPCRFGPSPAGTRLRRTLAQKERKNDKRNNGSRGWGSLSRSFFFLSVFFFFVSTYAREITITPDVMTFHERFVRPLILSITKAKWTRHALATPLGDDRPSTVQILAGNQYSTRSSDGSAIAYYANVKCTMSPKNL